MLKPEVMPDTVQFFRKEQVIYLFDRETFKVYVCEGARWAESDDPTLREDIRFRSIELSRREALQEVVHIL